MERMLLCVFHSCLYCKHLGWLWANHLITRIILTIDLIAWVLNIHCFIQSSYLPYDVYITHNTSDYKSSLSEIALLYPHCPSILIISVPLSPSRVSLFGWYIKLPPCNEKFDSHNRTSSGARFDPRLLIAKAHILSVFPLVK